MIYLLLLIFDCLMLTANDLAVNCGHDLFYSFAYLPINIGMEMDHLSLI